MGAFRLSNTKAFRTFPEPSEVQLRTFSQLIKLHRQNRPLDPCSCRIATPSNRVSLPFIHSSFI